MEIKPDSKGEMIYESFYILSKYNNKTMIARDDDIVLLQFKNEKFFYKKFSLEMKNNYYNIIKLKNNDFIFYSDNHMLLIKSY